MVDKFIFQIFLFGVAISEWIEITKVGSKTDKSAGGSSNAATYTVPSYEITLHRPQIYEIKSNARENGTASANSGSGRENASGLHENQFSNATVNIQNVASTSVEESEETFTSSEEMVTRFYPANTGVGSVAQEISEQIKDNSKESLVDEANNETVTFYPANEFETTIQRTSEDNATIIEVNKSRKEEDGIQEQDISIGDMNDEEEEDEFEETEGENADRKESFSGFMSVVNHVQSQLLDFKGKSLDAKVEHLRKLRDNILYEIKYRISRLFKTSEESTHNSRMFKDDEHYMDYPSNEGALITIGFLTFAVFLIKLVLKLVQSLKFKEQFYYQTSTTPASIFLKRTQREVEEEQLENTAKILRYLEEYSP